MNCIDSRIVILTSGLAALVLATGCPADDSSGATEGDTDATGSSSTAGADDVNDVDDVDGSTTDQPGSTGTPDTTDGDSSSGGADESSSGGTMADGTCVGLDQVGTIGTVLGLDGASPGGGCNAAPAGCGGDIVGSWTFDDTCGQDMIPNPLECEGSEFTVTVDNQTGTFDFVDDGTFTQSVETTQTIELRVETMACYGVDCATFETSLQAEDPAWSCQANGTECRCDITTMGGSDTSGTYETAGNTVTLTVDGDTGTLEYCRANDRLDLWAAIVEPTVTDQSCVDDQACLDALGDTHDLYVCVQEGE